MGVSFSDSVDHSLGLRRSEGQIVAAVLPSLSAGHASTGRAVPPLDGLKTRESLRCGIEGKLRLFSTGKLFSSWNQNLHGFSCRLNESVQLESDRAAFEFSCWFVLNNFLIRSKSRGELTAHHGAEYWPVNTAGRGLGECGEGLHGACSTPQLVFFVLFVFTDAFQMGLMSARSPRPPVCTVAVFHGRKSVCATPSDRRGLSLFRESWMDFQVHFTESGEFELSGFGRRLARVRKCAPLWWNMCQRNASAC